MFLNRFQTDHAHLNQTEKFDCFKSFLNGLSDLSRKRPARIQRRDNDANFILNHFDGFLAK